MPISQPLVPKYLKQDELTQECKDLLSTLPTEKGWVASTFYKYQGFWHPCRHLQGILSCQKHFQAQDTDIILVTTPKSGTTWLKAILFTLLNRTRFPISQTNHPLLSNNPHVLVPFLEIKLYLEHENPDVSSIMSPRLFSTHMPNVSLPKSVHDSKCKLVYLCRNPKDTLTSLWSFTNKLRLQEMGTNSLEEAFERFCGGVSMYGPFWDHVLGYWEESLKNPEKVLFLKYEEIKEQPKHYLEKLACFLGCPFSLKEKKEGVVDDILEICSFDHLSKLQVNMEGKLPSGENCNLFFRKGEVGDSKNYFSPEMEERLDKISKEKLDGFALSVIY
ncbi:putative Sulfotransferase domain, P-loop containing nucleoside triphosphate hydrolase [Helianthus annuus]|uniref:Sulfotransferase n=1 Tax=Helianthus annuus TaxID=4232 RepID=A0A251RQ50_HELAN|nr:putative Sulfotransferase domain, P-loop containing nucleoside triphosphate hydrolase [Helianthus annuus]KAJ0632367.1 putative Sulfotransferase domain, P-loop containing nucleoside triphosphate hydrolase [Helianthus annuus]KAJ0636258.1 putative Sulfotransferase domain, P-loop containing nucleoside triphosphate hydrolase [Helianthus annuus]